MDGDSALLRGVPDNPRFPLTTLWLEGVLSSVPPGSPVVDQTFPQVGEGATVVEVRSENKAMLKIVLTRPTRLSSPHCCQRANSDIELDRNTAFPLGLTLGPSACLVKGCSVRKSIN